MEDGVQRARARVNAVRAYVSAYYASQNLNLNSWRPSVAVSSDTGQHYWKVRHIESIRILFSTALAHKPTLTPRCMRCAMPRDLAGAENNISTWSPYHCLGCAHSQLCLLYSTYPKYAEAMATEELLSDDHARRRVVDVLAGIAGIPITVRFQSLSAKLR